jgi:phosphoribosylformylglycinamidine synthase
MHAVAEAARNVACSGARPMAATNCLNFGSPEKPEVMWQFSEAIDGLTVACTEFGTPITGGNVSFYNETLGKSIYPTPVIGILGILDDANQILKIAFREAGDIIVLLDGTSHETGRLPFPDVRQEFSSSEYSKTVAGIVAGEPPAIDLAAEKRLQELMVSLASESLLQSAHDLSDGGLCVTLAECLFLSTAKLGAQVDLEDHLSPEFALFGESGARVIVSIRPTLLGRVLEAAKNQGVAAGQIGKVIQTPTLRIKYKGSAVVDSSVEALQDVWSGALQRALKVPA